MCDNVKIGIGVQQPAQHHPKECVIVKQQELDLRHYVLSGTAGCCSDARASATAKQHPWGCGSYSISPWNARTKARERYNPSPDACAPGWKGSKSRSGLAMPGPLSMNRTATEVPFAKARTIRVLWSCPSSARWLFFAIFRTAFRRASRSTQTADSDSV